MKISASTLCRLLTRDLEMPLGNFLAQAVAGTLMGNFANPDYEVTDTDRSRILGWLDQEHAESKPPEVWIARIGGLTPREMHTQQLAALNAARFMAEREFCRISTLGAKP